MGVPIRRCLQHLGLGPLGIVVRKAAMIQRALAVNHVDWVPGAMPKHPHAVAAFLGVQPAITAAYFVCIKQFHPYKVNVSHPQMQHQVHQSLKMHLRGL